MKKEPFNIYKILKKIGKIPDNELADDMSYEREYFEIMQKSPTELEKLNQKKGSK